MKVGHAQKGVVGEDEEPLLFVQPPRGVFRQGPPREAALRLCCSAIYALAKA